LPHLDRPRGAFAAKKNNFSSEIGKAQTERAPAALLISIFGMVPEVGVEPTRF
jgi:hypothetical protein